MVSASALHTGNAHPQNKMVDKGDFKVGISPARPKNKVTAKMDAETRATLQELADELNKTFILPENIYLSIEECGQANAFYDPNTKEIILCTELIVDFSEAFAKEFEKEADVDEAVGDATVFVFFHELGHALIDIYDLPVTGKEEDAVDQLSTIIVADGSPEGAASAFNGALAFALTAPDDLDDSAFWGVHSMNQQRFYNIVCLLYGQDPKAHKDLVNDEVLPKGRAASCPSEFARAEKAWDKILTPFLKK
ncbi:MAG: DUF4344 domain-containing metallopeptidase [Blastocatellia bacterium]